MRTFGDRLIASITSAEIERFLRRLDREGLTGRNVNVHRQVLPNVFEYATRADTFALPLSRASGAPSRSPARRSSRSTSVHPAPVPAPGAGA